MVTGNEACVIYFGVCGMQGGAVRRQGVFVIQPQRGRMSVLITTPSSFSCAVVTRSIGAPHSRSKSRSASMNSATPLLDGWAKLGGNLARASEKIFQGSQRRQLRTRAAKCRERLLRRNVAHQRILRERTSP